MSNENNIFDEDEDEEWGGEENQVIIPDANIIATLLGVPQVYFLGSPIRPPSPEPVAGRVRPREETHINESVKGFKNINGKRIIKERGLEHSYLKLKSGEEFIFTEEDGKKILLTEREEPNRLIRNILSRVPKKVEERLDFLAKFGYDEESEEEAESEEDGEEKTEDADNRRKVKKRYLGNLKEAIYTAFIRESRLRFVFRRFLTVYRAHKMNKTAEKELDPITLSEPEKEVYVYDWANKKKFIFDAKSLATMIETNLMYQEYGFPIPIYPRNPKNNVDFTYGQIISIYNQLKEHGELRWGMTTLREYNFSKNRWHMFHRSALTLNAIKTSLMTLETFEARELLSDFIFAKMDDLAIRYNNYTFNTYQVAMARAPKHWYLEKLKALAIIHYEAEHFGHNKSRMINARIVRIFRKQTQFINDLKAKNII
jgi:hypothetical protein